MSDRKMHWYMVSLSFSIEGNPLQQTYTAFLSTDTKYENINKSMVNQFGILAKEQIEQNTNISIQHYIPLGIEYLGFMSGEEFNAI